MSEAADSGEMDVVIETDVRWFDLTAFTRAQEMAAIGEAAGIDAVPRIRQLLTRLDPQLFRPNGDTPDRSRSTGPQ